MKELTNVDNVTKAAHIENIEKKYKTQDVSEDHYTATSKSSSAAHYEVDPENTELICPKCGNKLVLRVAKKGENAGNHFYGCSAFPKCRYIQNI